MFASTGTAVSALMGGLLAESRFLRTRGSGARDQRSGALVSPADKPLGYRGKFWGFIRHATESARHADGDRTQFLEWCKLGSGGLELSLGGLEPRPGGVEPSAGSFGLGSSFMKRELRLIP